MSAPRRRRSLEIFAVSGVPRVQPGDDLAAILIQALTHDPPQDGDVLGVTSKLLSRAEGRFVRLSEVAVSDAARALADEVQKDPELVELILQESAGISRKRPGVLITRHRLGFISANAGIDQSNALPPGAEADNIGEWALLLPRDPDACAQELRDAIEGHFRVKIGVVITDSHGRPFRSGTVGVAIGAAGIRTTDAHEGRVDLDGRPLQVTLTAVADQLAAAADLVAGQADEGCPLVVLRGLNVLGEGRAADLYRDPATDLYA